MNRMFLASALAAAIFCAPLAAHAQTTKTDNAGNYTGDYNGGNAGTGFGTFTVTAVNGAPPYSGTFIGSSTGSENGSANIDTSGKSFGFYANGASTAAVTVTRSFTTPLQYTGDSFSLDFVPGYNDAGYAGVSLSSDTGDFRYQSGGAGFQFNGASTGQGFAVGALHLVYTVTSPGSYSLAVTGPFTFNGTGTYSGSLSGFSVFGTNSGSGDSAHNGYFNNLSVTNNPAPVPAPEPSGLFALTVGALALGGLTLARRRTITI